MRDIFYKNIRVYTIMKSIYIILVKKQLLKSNKHKESYTLLPTKKVTHLAKNHFFLFFIPRI